ncbi:DUF605-domain-containing protein [Yamadazyma tenuis ATCC 10573]|uniref:DUF605-domain-containing protein n=1 Tax=Candida tenuis (strain ATCC 10573 / BCRC 21748 / CBS 615 / JCM 9827 / NBRC 10315 / NRRL Y-1498 / VKM Y-70) TaxID=590646 RepID=G3B979_CANTC|nr:DUF605-domain-containing protein [Yamadazyma tenuis ATCC 10573]EGV61834.1 DUF605-domain-containing protein [Yamadazyma tenuis ATCC 10573]
MISDIPESLKTNKDIVPYIVRSNELEDINPIVSYYCKIYVLEHILNKKLHKDDKEVEAFTIHLLDDTELMKTSDDDSLTKVLNDKNLSINVVFSFSLKIFNGCIHELNNYTGAKLALVNKIKACLNFMSLTEVFKNDDIDFSSLTGGKYTSYDEFNKFNKDRIKLLKYNLSKLIKDEIEIKGEQDELDQELQRMESEFKEAEDEEPKEAEDETSKEDLPQETLPSLGSPEIKASSEDPPQFIDSEPEEPVTLPGVPHFSPDDDNDIKLPGAPQFLPHDDLSHINKTSAIHVFEPEKDDPQKKEPPKPQSKPQKKPVHGHAPITKEHINSILDRQESMTKAQKHCKFAVSALNYEDLDTAEKEVLQALEMIRLVKQAGTE